MMDSEDILFQQRLLKSQGIYLGTLDGKWGPKTNGAVIEAETRSFGLRSIGTFDPRTERLISGLHLQAQEKARRFLVAARERTKLSVRIISGTRTYAEQNALFRQGRYGNKGPRVTNAKGGQSNHNFAIAFDIGLFASDGSYLNGDSAKEIAEYDNLGKLANDLDLEWGGVWKFVDVPHYQLPIGGKSMAEIRRLFESGLNYV